MFFLLAVLIKTEMLAQIEKKALNFVSVCKLASVNAP